MKIVCIGDSITYGFSLRRDETWVNILKNKTGFDFLNKGINGDTSLGILSRFYKDVIKEKPDILLFMAGLNDIFISRSLSSLKLSIASISQQSLANGITPILMIPVNFYIDMINENYKKFVDFDNARNIFNEYIKWLYDYTKTFNIILIDMFSLFNEYLQSNNLNYKDCYIDGLHLNTNGNIIFADILYLELNRILNSFKNK